jgi:hypothetical protein
MKTSHRPQRLVTSEQLLRLGKARYVFPATAHHTDAAKEGVLFSANPNPPQLGSLYEQGGKTYLKQADSMLTGWSTDAARTVLCCRALRASPARRPLPLNETRLLTALCSRHTPVHMLPPHCQWLHQPPARNGTPSR